MTDRASQFVDQMTAAINLMMEKAPKDLSICFSVYARDPSNRTIEQPDGTSCMTSAARCGYFDKAAFKEYVNTFYTRDITHKAEY